MTRRDDLLDRAVVFIAATVEERGYPPTIRELADELGYRSVGSAHGILVELEKRGRIRRDPHSPRAITLTRETAS